MQESTHKTTVNTESFNYNKLQAVVCIVSSSIVSIALIAWAVKTFL
jgi:hypothetical protein